jgi:hypothetical protein
MCIECGIPIGSASSHDFLEKALRHGREHHTTWPTFTAAERRLIYQSCLLGFKTIAFQLAKCTSEQAIAQLTTYLGNDKKYPFCTHELCNKLVVSKTNHGHHYPYCNTELDGCCPDYILYVPGSILLCRVGLNNTGLK